MITRLFQPDIRPLITAPYLLIIRSIDCGVHRRPAISNKHYSTTKEHINLRNLLSN